MYKYYTNMFPEKKAFKDRLVFLYNAKGLMTESGTGERKIKFGDVVDELYSNGLCDESQTKRKFTMDTIRKHAQSIDSAQNISGHWIHIYCEYFGCSADFLMGYIDVPNYRRLMEEQI